MTAALVLVPGLPLLAALVLLLTGRRLDRVAPALAILVAAVTVVTTIVAAITRPAVMLPFITPDGAALAVDGLAAILLPTVAAVVLLVLIFAAADKIRPAARFHGFMLLFTAAVMVTVTATSLPALLAAWEVMGATSYALIGFRWWKSDAMPAGLIAFAVTRAADLGLYTAAAAAIGAGSGWRLDGLANAHGPWLHVLAGGVLLAGLGKAAQLPFSFWLARAMAGPSPVSALLHSAAMVAMGGYLLLRLHPLLAASGWAGPMAAWLGAATAVVLGVVALAQTDLKQLLAASTAAQLGFVVLAVGIGAIGGGTAQLVAHAATKALLFLAAGAWLTAVGSKQLPALRGVGRRWPVVGATFLIGALSLAGLPPLSLWLTKDEVLAAALAEGPALYAAGLVAAALAAGYSAKMIAVVWARPDREQRVAIEHREWDTEEPGTRRIPAAATMPLIVLAAAALLLGVLAALGLSAPFRSLLGAAGQPESSGAELLASAAIAAVVSGLVLLRGVPRMPGAATWFGLERAARTLLVRPMDRVAHGLARFDGGLDRAVHGTARWVGNAASGAEGLDRGLGRAVLGTGRLLQDTATGTGGLDRGVGRAVRAVTAGAAGLGRLTRRAHNGAVADYYAAATVVTVVVLVLLILVR